MARKTLTPAARQRLAAIVERYKPETLSARVATSITEASGLEFAAVSLCRDELERARAAFESNRWKDAQQLYAEIQGIASRIADSGASGRDARAVFTSALLGQVACLLNLQEADRARELLSILDQEPLDTRQSTVLARALVELNDEARARAILDAVPEPERDTERWREASALVEFARGNVPETFERVPSVLYALARKSLITGEVGKAAAVAFEALAKDAKNPILVASLVSTAMVALMRTLFEDDLADEGIGVDERPECARKIAAEFKTVFSAEMPTHVRANALEVALNYVGSLRERDLFRWILSNSDQTERDKGQPNEVRLAFQSAEKGDLTKALELMPRQNHPWRTDLMRSQLLRAAGDQDAALEILNGLVAAWPGRVPIHIALAELFVERRQFELALPHAEAAYRGFGTPSMALVFARCLVETERGRRALEVVEHLDTTEHVLELRAYAADQANDPRAPMYWSQLLTYDSNDANAKLRLAAALFRSGDIEEAARHARELLELSFDALGRDQIAACGQILSMARFLPTSDELIQRAADALRTRFPNDDRAEMLRLTLLTSLGFPAGTTPIDYERLVRAGHLKAISIDDAATLLKDRTALVSAAHDLYREGWLDAETLCEVTGIRVATLVVGWLKAAASGRTPLRAAIVPGLTTEVESISGRHFLCSSIELLLLQKCGALEHLPAVIGDGSLVALDSIWVRLVDDVYYLEQSTQRDELARLERLLAKIAAAPRLRRLESTSAEREVARRDGLVFVTTELREATDVDARSLLRGLVDVAAVSRLQCEHAIKYLGGERPDTPSAELNARFLLENGLLELFDAAGILDALLSVVSEMSVSNAAIASIRHRLDELQTYGEAARLQRQTIEQLGAGLRAGWFRLTQPAAVSLPSLRDDVDQEQAKLLTRSIRHQAVFKELLNRNLAWTRIAADSFGFDSLGHPQQWRMLAFQDDRQGQAFIRKYWRPGKREITLSRFARSIVRQPQRSSVMRALAQLGFADALLPDDVASLVKEYGRADAGGAARVLDGMESSAGDAQSRGVFSRMQLSIVYAMAIWKLAKARAELTTQPVSQQLLSRLERLDQQYSSRLVEQTVCNVMLAALDDREASFVEAGPDLFQLVPSSIAGQLWTELSAWEKQDAHRKTSLRRALAHAWEQLGHLKDGPREAAQWAPLALATDVLAEGTRFDAPIPNPDAVVAVVSALWKTRPLARKKIAFKSKTDSVDVDIETLLMAATIVLSDEHGEWRLDDGTTLAFQYTPTSSQGAVEVSVPVEAVLLRMEAQSAARVARQLAISSGARDGRLYRALIEFSKAPTDKSRRKYVARAACGAPFRLVADDPRFILSFGDRASTSQQGYPSSLDELRELLSDPPDLVGADARTLVKRFFERFEEGGVWFSREDKYSLLELASRVPGPLPSAAARFVLAEQDDDDLKHIERALTVSQNMPIGMLSMATAFAMLVICKEPPSEHGSLMSTAFVGMLKRELGTTSENDTLASIEPAALQSVGRVVSRVAPWALPVVEHAWLTTRLYEWWMREVEVRDLYTFLKPEASLDWQRLRAEVVLNVVLDILEATVVTQGRVPSLPSSMLEILKAVASRHGTNPFEAAKRPAWIYWDRPQGCEWLASSVLLWGAPNAFFDLRPELRLSILEKLPRSNEQAKEFAISYQPVFRALSRGAEFLTDPEMSAMHQWLGAAESGALLDLWRAEFLTGMFASRGDTDAAAALRKLAGADTLRVARAEVVGGYLEAASSPKVTGMEATVIELLETVYGTEDADARIAAGVGLALQRPNRERVLAFLQGVLQMEALPQALRAVLETAITNHTAPAAPT